jgi:hypothetical protein
VTGQVMINNQIILAKRFPTPKKENAIAELVNS